MRTKWIYTMFVLALSLFTSCNNEVDEAAGNKKTRTVVFRLSVDDAVGSRAAWSENDSQQHGTPMENRINLKGLRVVIYSIQTDGTVDTRVGEAANVSYWPINDATNSNDPIEYQLVGDISDLKLEVGTSYRFMVFANFPHTTNNQFDVEDVDVTNGYIPLWGVKTCTLEHTDLQELGTIDLLRAAAKVEVTFAEGVTNAYTVSALAIKNYSSTGNNLPTGWESCRETKDLDMETCINATGSHVFDKFPFLANEENGKYYIYIPEYQNTSHIESERSMVVITLEDKNVRSTRTYEVPFCQYDVNGSPIANTAYNIVRNHIYQFHVNGVAAGGLLLNFKVADWEDGNSLALGSLAYPTYLNPLLPTRDHGYPQEVIENKAIMNYVAPTGEGQENNTSAREHGGFNAYFHFIDANAEIGTTDGYPWRPTIIDNINTNYTIKVYKLADDNTETLVYTSANDTDEQELKTDYKGWFRIVVVPEEEAPEDKKFTLGIACTIHPSGFPSEDFFLFINGENDKIAWPKSGTDRKFIEITQTVD